MSSSTPGRKKRQSPKGKAPGLRIRIEMPRRAQKTAFTMQPLNPPNPDEDEPRQLQGKSVYKSLAAFHMWLSTIWGTTDTLALAPLEFGEFGGEPQIDLLHLNTNVCQVFD
ncbi:hypothetical protein G7Y89_g2722 [Cudoniella acicularis]|uniref:Uncharacterized protein n=1 Tax=Cudoniella acicularis TaxID=354080 RepID=A0A8H4RSV6_9HELO|nr:hypothetical protein G7Y89_g2722 [Cudoniella acicularis]